MNRNSIRTPDRVRQYKPISADSHIVEPDDCYRDNIDPKFRDRAPHVKRELVNGILTDLFVIDGFPEKFPIRALASAGHDPKEDILSGLAEDAHPGGHEPAARIRAQDQDGVAGEILYPSFGMLICGHSDPDYKSACMWAYNRWLQKFCSHDPKRLFGLGQTSARSPAETIRDLEAIRAMGFRGVMMPGFPETEEDYSHSSWDPVWEACVDLGMPISFHILATGSTKNPKALPMSYVPRGSSKLSVLMNTMRSVQDVLMMFVFDGVFERHPNLKLVCSEADAGWAPHFSYRMDHNFKRMRHTMKSAKLSKLPSEFFKENVYLTFQDDWVAFKVVDLLNPNRLLWANDFPHGDSTWPNSQALLDEHAARLTAEQERAILLDNVSLLYGLDRA